MGTGVRGEAVVGDGVGDVEQCLVVFAEGLEVVDAEGGGGEGEEGEGGEEGFGFADHLKPIILQIKNN